MLARLDYFRPGLGALAGASAPGWFLVGLESAAPLLALGGSAQKSHVHLPLGQFDDLAVFHRRRGARLE